MKCIYFLILFPTLLLAQEFQFRQEFDTIPVEINGWQPAAPWTGGDSEISPELCDIDADGDLDFFIGNVGILSIGTRLLFYENIGNPMSPDFTYRTSFFGSILLDSMYAGRLDPCFVDIDDDGDFDLLSSCHEGFVHYWQNIGNQYNSDFVLITDSLQNIQALGTSHIEMGDLDGDGDYDMFMGNSPGRIEYYINTGTPEVPYFELNTSQFQNIDVGQRASPCFADIDGDGDKDLFIGNYTGELWFYRNDSDSTGLIFTFITENYNGIDYILYSSPDLADIDGDSDQDLFLGHDMMSSSTPQFSGIVCYQNVGTAQTASWEMISEQYLTWDLGRGINHNGVDINDDDDYDLFVSLRYCDYLAYYENIGSVQDASFLCITDNFQDIHVSSGKPFFADIDDDQDYDLFMGEGMIPNPPYPGLQFFENIGDPEHPNFNLISENLVPWNYSASVRPALVDIDADNDQDIFIFDNDGIFYFWENTGNTMQPEFTNPILNWQGISGTSPICFYDIDFDGDYDLFLLIYDHYNKLRFYENTGTPENAVMQLISEEFLGTDIELVSPERIDIVDIDDDGDGDFLIAGYRGGMMFFRNITDTSSAPPYQKYPYPCIKISFGPNPANPITWVTFNLPYPQKATLAVYNLLGQKVTTLAQGLQPPGSQTYFWNASNFSSGVYLIQLETDIMTEAGKVVVIR